MSGDFYDAFELADGRLAVVVADVCDKGVGAALYMALFRSLMRAAADSPAESGTPFASRALHLANDYIAETHDRSHMFATVFAAEVDPASGELVYANGGHEPPAILRASGDIERLDPTAPAVGLMAGTRFETRRVTLDPGDSLFAFTDGLTEARSPSGELYEDHRLLDVIGSTDGPVDTVLDAIEAAVDRHVGGGPRSDDMTLLVVQREPRSVSATAEFEKGVA